MLFVLLWGVEERNMRYFLCRFLAGAILLGLAFPTAGQRITSPEEFDAVYNRGMKWLESADTLAARTCLDRLMSYEGPLVPIREVKRGFFRLKLEFSNRQQKKAIEQRIYSVPDSLRGADSLLWLARRFLERSMPDRAVPLLMLIIQRNGPERETVVKARIGLAEAYRQKREYAKGIALLYGLMAEKPDITVESRAQACNRMAALYNEWANPPLHYSDSVFHYSERCIALAEQCGSLPEMAAAQNELSYQYIRRRDFSTALRYSEKAVFNFRKSGMTYHAMSALINQAIIYCETARCGPAVTALIEAVRLCPIEENRNLHMRIYFQFVTAYEELGDLRTAFDFLKICNALQFDFFLDRIDRQINEESARYDLLVKEQNILEERRKNEFNQRQIVLLVIILVFLCVAFLLSFFYLRSRREGALRQQLMEAVAETEANERKRIARDLHDGLGPVLSAVNHYFQAYLDAPPNDRETIRDRLQQVISEAIDEVSRISHNISPHVLEHHGLVTAVRNCIAPVKQSGKISVDFTSDLERRFDLKKELTLYRCVTELLNNTIRHSGADRITIGLSDLNRVLVVKYTDNGRGFDPRTIRPEGMGLANIRTRVEAFGGKITIDSAPEKGLQALIELPI